MRTWKRGALAAGIAALALPLGAARCTAEGPGGTPLPVHMWAYWKRQNEGGDVKRTPHIERPGAGFQLKGKTPLGQYVWYGPERPLSNSGP